MIGVQIIHGMKSLTTSVFVIVVCLGHTLVQGDHKVSAHLLITTKVQVMFNVSPATI
jgi:hypothetical protein